MRPQFQNLKPFSETVTGELSNAALRASLRPLVLELRKWGEFVPCLWYLPPPPDQALTKITTTMSWLSFNLQVSEF